MFDIMTLFIAYFSNWLQLSQIYNLENTYMCQLARSFFFFFLHKCNVLYFLLFFHLYSSNCIISTNVYIAIYLYKSNFVVYFFFYFLNDLFRLVPRLRLGNGISSNHDTVFNYTPLLTKIFCEIIRPLRKIVLRDTEFMIWITVRLCRLSFWNVIF